MEPERCAECGFDGTRLTIADVVTALRSLGRRWRALFDGVPDGELRRRPAPEVWSALEYAAHTRDVLKLLGTGVETTLGGRSPAFPAVEPDPPGHDRGYNSLDPEVVLGELTTNAEALAELAERTPLDDWKRTCTIGGEERDARWLLVHAVHDATHHLRDVERGLERKQE